MGRYLFIALVWVTGHAAGLPAQQTDFAPALPRGGAWLTLRNELIDAWDVTWIKDAPTPMHRHDYDYLGVELAPSETLLTAPDGATRTITLDRGRVWFLRKGVTHQETGLTDDPPRHAIIVELTGIPTPPVPNDTGFGEGPVDAGRKPVIDNGRVSIWDVTWSEERSDSTRFHSRPVVLMFMEDTELAWRDPEGARGGGSFEEGEAHFFPAGGALAVWPTGGPARMIVVELKDGA
jgi:hypothetical protein